MSCEPFVRSGLSVRYCAISPARRAPSVRSSLVTRVSRENGTPDLQAASAGATHASSIGGCGSGRSLRFPSQRIAPPVSTATAVAARTGLRLSPASKRTCSSRSVRPMASGSEGRPSLARSCRISSASSLKRRTTCSGLPRNFARRSGRCVAMPVGHVLR